MWEDRCASLTNEPQGLLQEFAAGTRIEISPATLAATGADALWRATHLRGDSQSVPRERIYAEHVADAMLCCAMPRAAYFPRCCAGARRLRRVRIGNQPGDKRRGGAAQQGEQVRVQAVHVRKGQKGAVLV